MRVPISIWFILKNKETTENTEICTFFRCALCVLVVKNIFVVTNLFCVRSLGMGQYNLCILACLFVRLLRCSNSYIAHYAPIAAH
jgi:hypothetical protein